MEGAKGKKKKKFLLGLIGQKLKKKKKIIQRDICQKKKKKKNLYLIHLKKIP
jgi:hypothetical protein